LQWHVIWGCRNDSVFEQAQIVWPNKLYRLAEQALLDNRMSNNNINENLERLA